MQFVDIVTNITIAKLNQHLIEVEIIFTSQFDSPNLEMPLWTPGSYLIREFARHVQNLAAYDNNGTLIKSHKTSKNSWQIDAKQDQLILVKYEVYAFELTVRTSYLDNRKCLINPASVCMYITSNDKTHNLKNQPYKITITYPEGWNVFTSLEKIGEYYHANNFDELVDSPIAIGDESITQTHEYTYFDNQKNIPNTVVFMGDQSHEDLTRFSEDMKKLQDNSVDMFGRLPYNRYLWIVFITENRGGGLEHKYSNTSITTRYSFKDPKKYTKLLSLEAHEHFHTYNIKRIRPKQLGPFDYSQEVYTSLLWIAEGLTSFYDNIILPRSSLISREEYWKLFSDDLERYFQTPGRYVDSLESASFDAWIKLYRPNENTINSTVSYYLKGGIVGFMLDLEIRRQTDSEHSLDTFYKAMYEKYLIEKSVGYKETLVQSLIEEATNTDLEDFWNKYISGTSELELEPYLDLIGMNLQRKSSNKVPYVGIKFSNNSTVVNSVLSNSPAEKSGIYAFDEIIAINGYKVSKSNFNEVLKNYEVGTLLDIHLFRDGKLLTTILTLEEPVLDKVTITKVENITDVQKSNLDLFFYNQDKSSADKF